MVFAYCRRAVVLVSVINDPFVDLVTREGVHDVPNQMQQERHRQIYPHLLDKRVVAFLSSWRASVRNVNDGGHRDGYAGFWLHPNLSRR